MRSCRSGLRRTWTILAFSFSWMNIGGGVVAFICQLHHCHQAPAALAPNKNKIFGRLFSSSTTVESTGTNGATGTTTTDDGGMSIAEEVVFRYFDGVNRKDPEQLRSCFGERATITDICNPSVDAPTTSGGAPKKTVASNLLVDRCMEFVTAHPDCAVNFHYGPIEIRNSNENNNINSNDNADSSSYSCWVLAHWYETGHWSEDSCGIPAPEPPKPMACQGQTRFRVVVSPKQNSVGAAASEEEEEEAKIEELVVARTFTEWENEMIALRELENKQQQQQVSSQQEENNNNNSNNNNSEEEHSVFSSSSPSSDSATASNPLLQSMANTAERAARAAGQVIMDSREEFCAIDYSDGCSGSDETIETAQKLNIKDIVTKYDKEAQVAVEAVIRSEFPEHSFLGEEDVAAGGDASAQALVDALSSGESSGSNDCSTGNKDYVWIVDPIDGTANFASGLDLCGVTVAVVHKHSNEALIGVIYDPHKDEMFVAVKGRGSYCNGVPIGRTPELLGASGATKSSSISLKDAIINAGCPADPNAFAASMRGVKSLNSECRGLRIIACSALTLAWVASNRLGGHFGYDLSSWDLVAGALLIQEAGGTITDIDGLPYQVTTRNMLASSPDCSSSGSNANGESVHDKILKLLREADAISFERAS